MSISMISRRTLLSLGLGVGAAALMRATAYAAPGSAQRNPFSLGVASGFPTADGMVLWTRLAPLPLAPDGGMPATTVPVRWQLAADEGMRNIVQSGVSYATPDWAHSVHVEPRGLEPARPYWYRFISGDAESPIGCTHTAPAEDIELAKLRLALVSCQHYEHGYYVAYRRLLEDHPDLVVHVGDYIYELSHGEQHVRSHGAGEAYTLEDYRIRHALYRSDPDLQAAHAACPWLLIWDDHEVDNDYAGDSSEQDDPPELFRARRAAAYRAYYEHLPLPRRAVPFGPDMRLFARRSFGSLANIYLLDERQYRNPQACPLPGRRGSNRVSDDCAELLLPTRTMLGERQEAWLSAQLGASKARWNLLAQGVMMSYADEQPGPGTRFRTDTWNGYPAARERLLQALLDSRAANPIVLSGDIHAFAAGDLNLQPAQPDSPVVASEFVTTSITSQPPAEQAIAAVRDNNPNLRLATGLHRGYTRIDLAPWQLRADLIAMDSVRELRTGSRVLRSFIVQAGQPGLQDA
ncbi:MAG: alkaline phosphatase [Dehalococcoidia bacterium]